MSEDRLDAGLMPGMLFLALALVLALALGIAGELRDCSPPVHDRNGDLVQPRCAE